MAWKHAPTAFDDEIKNLGQEAMSLLRDCSLIDSTLRTTPKIEANRPARDTLIRQKESMMRQRHTVLARQRQLAGEREIQRRLALLGESPSITSGLREYTRRVGYLEQLYFDLIENRDDPKYDWKKSLAKVRKMLGDVRPGDDESEELLAG